MAERERINFFPTEEDSKLIAQSIAFHGGDGPDALRRGLRAGNREIELCGEVLKKAAAAMPAQKKKPANSVARRLKK